MEHCESAGACADAGGEWIGYSMMPVGVSSPIAVPGYGNESEVLDWFEVACEGEGYEGSVTVTCKGRGGGMSKGGGRVCGGEARGIR